MKFTITILYVLSTLACILGQEVIDIKDVRCDKQEGSDICLGCSQLSPVIQVPLDKCCSEAKSFSFCEACLTDPESCSKLSGELEELAEFENEQDFYDDVGSDVNVDDDDTLQDLFASVSDADTANDNSRAKRFGRLFMKTPKRYGRLLFGKRDSEMDSDLQKRFGRLYLGSGSYFGKRADNDMEKRYGSLFMNKNRWFGKRSEESDLSADKRYGSLFIGKSRNGWFGKRSDDSDVLDDEYDESNDVMKRYGPLFIGNGGYFGKRSEPIVANKRYGTLFMGRRRGSWLG